MPDPRDDAEDEPDGLRCRARHGSAIASADLDAAGPAGRYGRMFPSLDPCPAGESTLAELARMLAGSGVEDLGANPRITAGFTYLGQFVDHDITFEPTSVLGRRNDLRTLVNLRSPRLDLDSVYGGGPAVQPYLYDWDERRCAGVKLLTDGPFDDPELADRDLPATARAGR